MRSAIGLIGCGPIRFERGSLQLVDWSCRVCVEVIDVQAPPITLTGARGRHGVLGMA